MKFSVATMVAAVAAVAISAHATTGMPSQAAREHSGGTSAAIDTGAGAELGSYGRYLMLNGKSREEAIVEASSIDHPGSRSSSPSHTSSHAILTKDKDASLQYVRH